MKVTRADIRGVVGIVPTPATEDAASWRATSTIAIDETVKMVEAVVSAGIGVLMTTGTFGECATLTWDEHQEFVDLVVATARRRLPVFAGVTTLNTRDTIARARRLLERGADGLFVGRPMWLALDQDGIYRYYRDVAEALPGTPLVVYDNAMPFKGKISTDLYRRLAGIPEVVASKHTGGPALAEDIAAVGDRITILPLDSDWYEISRKFPDRTPACWSGNVACAPTPLVALGRAIAARDWATAERITARVKWALEKQFPGGDFARFMDNSIPIGHARFRTAGLVNPGPSRPPYTDAPADCIAGGEETGRRWAIVEKEFIQAAAPQAVA